MTERSGRSRTTGLGTLTQIQITGFKSLRNQQSIEVRPLTILAGANSSGKSSIMQAVLLLKQTLESNYDPGPLLLDGPHAKFSKASQLFFRGKGRSEKQFKVNLAIRNVSHTMVFSNEDKVGLKLAQMDWAEDGLSLSLKPQMSLDEIAAILRNAESAERSPRSLNSFLRNFPSEIFETERADDRYVVNRNRCFFELRRLGFPVIVANPTIVDAIRSIIHVPGLRGNPTRSYPVTAVGSTFAGTFESYTASVIARWQDDSGTPQPNPPNTARRRNIDLLGRYLRDLGLTWKVQSKRVDDTRVELLVGRTLQSSRGGSQDMVNVADVGFGVSQTLPVLVALLAARPGQVVYLEQPEIHLHPRAQHAMAKILADAANRGVRVIAETHSALLLTGIQTLIAQGDLSADKVKLHWFARDEGGETTITSVDPDETGAFGDWPVDFDEVLLKAEGDYLDSVENLAQGKLF